MANRYESILHSPRPEHKQDAFSVRHPPMARGHRAKLFAPFDALSGYGEALAEQEIVYQEREVLSEERRQELDAKLDHLLRVYRERKSGTRYVGGSFEAKPFEPPVVTVQYFEEMPRQAGRGQYHTLSGKVVKLDLSRRCLMLAADNCPELVCVPLCNIIQYFGEIFEPMEDFFNNGEESFRIPDEPIQE